MSTKTRWTFYFDTGHVVTDSEIDLNNEKIKQYIQRSDIFVPCQYEKGEMFVNLNLVKCATNEQVIEPPVVVPEIIE